MKLLGCCVGLGVGFLAACSGRYDMGSEPMGGAAGTAPSAGTGSETLGGSDGVGGSGSSVAGVGPVAGSAPVAGSGPVVVPPRCDYGVISMAPFAGFVSSDELANRVYRFLDASAAPTNLTLPPMPSSAWVVELADDILDRHADDQTPALGLERFLLNWLPEIPQDAPATAAPAWALKLTSADATLATLLSEPTGEPHRFGIVTEPDVLSSKTRISARGGWMLRSLFCTDAPAPPPNLPPFDPTPPKGVTFREHLEQSLAPAVCRACHSLLDPMGDSLEHFDEQGNYRTLDNGLPVDASGQMNSPVSMNFTDYSSLAPQLAESCEVAACVSKLVYTDALKAALGNANVPLSEAEATSVASQFAASEFEIRTLVHAIVTTPSFLQ